MQLTDLKEELYMLDVLISENRDQREKAVGTRELNRCNNRKVKLKRIREKLESYNEMASKIHELELKLKGEQSNLFT